MIAKRIISKDGVDPGNVMHAALEIMPETARLKAGTNVKLKVLYEGKPLPKVKVICYHEGDDELEFKFTDDNGILEYHVPSSGMCVFIAKYTDVNKKVDEEFDETGFTTTLTLEAD
jgi:uncharacterized GH25 family protein